MKLSGHHFHLSTVCGFNSCVFRIPKIFKQFSSLGGDLGNTLRHPQISPINNIQGSKSQIVCVTLTFQHYFSYQQSDREFCFSSSSLVHAGRSMVAVATPSGFCIFLHGLPKWQYILIHLNLSHHILGSKHCHSVHIQSMNVKNEFTANCSRHEWECSCIAFFGYIVLITWSTTTVKFWFKATLRMHFLFGFNFISPGRARHSRREMCFI